VLWQSQQDLHNAFNSGYPTAQSAYATKELCVQASQGWSIPEEKVIAMDPYIIENKAYRVTYRCLPTGIKPIGTP
jgi:hypothetical protein